MVEPGLNSRGLTSDSNSLPLPLVPEPEPAFKVAWGLVKTKIACLIFRTRFGAAENLQFQHVHRWCQCFWYAPTWRTISLCYLTSGLQWMFQVGPARRHLHPQTLRWSQSHVFCRSTETHIAVAQGMLTGEAATGGRGVRGSALGATAEVVLSQRWLQCHCCQSVLCSSHAWQQWHRSLPRLALQQNLGHYF